MENKIEIKKSNYKDYFPISIIAFSFATSGAQGDPGGIKIMDINGKIFYLNHAYGDLSLKEVCEICPPLKKENKEKEPEEWQIINMGMGNSLFINKSILQQFEEETKDIKKKSDLYRRWINIILNIIKQQLSKIIKAYNQNNIY